MRKLSIALAALALLTAWLHTGPAFAQNPVSTGPVGSVQVGTAAPSDAPGLLHVGIDSAGLYRPPLLTTTGIQYVQTASDASRVSRMFTASVASTATAETLITLTYSNALAATSTCSTCAVTNAKTLRIQSVTASVRNTTGTTAGTATINVRAAVSGSCTATSPLQAHAMVAIPASTVPTLFPVDTIPGGFDLPYGAGSCFGVTITHPQWVTGSVVATFDISIAAYEY